MVESGMKRGPYKKSLARRRRIADAVLAIVDSDGPEAVTTAAVAERTAIPESSVLYHFPTKDHLLVAAMQRADDQLYEETRLGHEGARLDLDALRDSFDAGAASAAGRARLEYLVRALAMNPEHPAATYVAERNRRAVQVWSRMIARRQEEGLADAALDPQATAWQAIALLEGFARFSGTDPGPWSDQGLDLGDLVVGALSRLLGAGRARPAG